MLFRVVLCVFVQLESEMLPGWKAKSPPPNSQVPDQSGLAHDPTEKVIHSAEDPAYGLGRAPASSGYVLPLGMTVKAKPPVTASLTQPLLSPKTLAANSNSSSPSYYDSQLHREFRALKDRVQAVEQRMLAGINDHQGGAALDWHSVLDIPYEVQYVGED